jgi:hypothetical protein
MRNESLRMMYLFLFTVTTLDAYCNIALKIASPLGMPLKRIAFNKVIGFPRLLVLERWAITNVFRHFILITRSNASCTKCSLSAANVGVVSIRHGRDKSMCIRPLGRYGSSTIESFAHSAATVVQPSNRWMRNELLRICKLGMMVYGSREYTALLSKPIGVAFKPSSFLSKECLSICEFYVLNTDLLRTYCE